MNKITSILLSPRFTSFYWRSGAMVGAGLLNLLVEDLSGFGLNPTMTVLVGLVLGEISKALSNMYLEDKPAGFTSENVVK